MGASFSRKLVRKQMRELAKSGIDAKVLTKQVETLPQALALLKEIISQLNDAQTAVVQVLQELDAKDFELRRQRAVFLRMHMEMARHAGSIVNPGDPQRVLELEETVRGEYDAMFGLVAAFSQEQPVAENGT
jgi:biotin operon repressor